MEAKVSYDTLVLYSRLAEMNCVQLLTNMSARWDDTESDTEGELNDVVGFENGHHLSDEQDFFVSPSVTNHKMMHFVRVYALSHTRNIHNYMLYNR